ncbi:MAG: (2Fe-2S)-binding protein [Elusimicrobiota bacterium]
MTKTKREAVKAAGGRITVRSRINGRERTFSAKPGDYLLDALRREGFKGVKRGCDNGDCGACTVLLDGKPALSCLLFAAQAHGREVTTIEGLGTPREPHPLQKAFAETGATQCGFCVPGMIMSAKALLDKEPEPSDDAIRRAVDGNLCRCTGYIKQIEAVRLAAGRMRTAKRRES